MRKIIQLVIRENDDCHIFCWVLCNDGTVWTQNFTAGLKSWEKSDLFNIPQEGYIEETSMRSENFPLADFVFNDKKIKDMTQQEFEEALRITNGNGLR